MLRLRLFRLLLPLLLVALATLLWFSWEPRSSPHTQPEALPGSEAPRAVGLTFKEFRGSEDAIAGDADLFEPGEDDALHLEGIRHLEIQRDDREPLIVKASRGDRRGTEGNRIWHFEDEVVFLEEESGLSLSLSSLEIDQESGVARSDGDIRFEAPDLRGTAESLTYGLKGQPGELVQPEIEQLSGGRLTADRAVLLDGIRDIELIGTVRVRQQSQELDAGKARLIRRDDRLREAFAAEGVRASWESVGGPPTGVTTREMNLRWDASGLLEFMQLTGEALIQRGDESLSASTIRAERVAGEEAGWQVEAEQQVYVRRMFGPQPGLLRAERVHAELSDTLELQRANAEGRMTFESPETRAEAIRATFVAGPRAGDGEVELIGDGRSKARLANAQTRVAARTIRTDTRGDRLLARELVEATLLPTGQPAESPGEMHLFVASEAIHFVADRLESEQAGKRLIFTGTVRGWQGERNLAAERVDVDQSTHRLQATDSVSTRVPREGSASAASEEDFIQIGADRLDYDDATGRAIYEGSVRVRLLEGWLEAERVELVLDGESRKVREVRASGSVSMEIHRTADGDMPRPLAGTADRLLYTPPDATLKLYGDEAPAAVRRIGAGGGTTTGRVLTYHMDSGTLDVDPGGQSGRIVTSGA